VTPDLQILRWRADKSVWANGAAFAAATCTVLLILGCGGGGASPEQEATRPSGAPLAPSKGSPHATVELPPTPTPGGEIVIPKVKPIFGARDIIPTLDPSALTVGDPARGKVLFNTIGCSGCHSVGSDVIVGPGLGGVRARSAERVAQIKLVPRQSLSITPGKYVEDSILNPHNFIVPGFENAPKMESFAHLSSQELADLLAYVESLP